MSQKESQNLILLVHGPPFDQELHSRFGEDAASQKAGSADRQNASRLERPCFEDARRDKSLGMRGSLGLKSLSPFV